MVSVFLFRRPKTHFFAPQITENGRFRVQKNGTSDGRIQNRTQLFCRELYPKMVDETLVSYEYHFFAIFGKIKINRDFLPRFWPIPFYKVPKSKPYAALSHFLR